MKKLIKIVALPGLEPRPPYREPAETGRAYQLRHRAILGESL